MLLAASGGGHRARPPVASPAVPGPAAPAKGLAIGLTEANADLLLAPGASVPAPPDFAAARASLTALHPAYLRLVVDWAKLQPAPGGPAQFDGPVDGCLRGAPPCGAYAGVRDELRAIASQQRARGGFEPVIVIDGVPAWAAATPSGCERAGIPATARPIRPQAIVAYRALIAGLLALGRSEGVQLRWWSPWNEPNHPFFISPQRAACSASAPPRSPGVYAELARAMAGELRAAGGDHRMLIGELAGFTAAGPRATSISEFVAAMPPDVLCLGGVWSVHAYARRGAAAAAPGPVGQLEEALNRRGGCAAQARVWVTETGAGGPHAGRPRPPGAADERAGCRALATALRRWYGDPRVDAAFQYTFREDSLFPVGLADARLTRLYPAYELWRAWGGTRPASGPAPPLPPACA